MFETYKFNDYIYKALAELGFVKPTKIQEIVIPKVLRGENVIGKSQTGTGKTHAFLLPLINNLTKSNEIDVVIIVPTRELAMQIYNEVNKITKHSHHTIDTRIYVGGTNRETEMSRLEKSQPKIAIGTIGKIKDLAVTSNLLKIHTSKTVVVDEADMVFESSEMEEIDHIFSKFNQSVQTLIFSATLPNEIISLLNKYISKFEIVDLSQKEISKSTSNHIFIPSKNKNKNKLLVSLLNSFHPYLALIFANTKTKVDEIADYMSSEGFKVGKLTGDLEPRERKQVLRRIKEGVYQYVVASDIASRGIDIIGVSHVINYELPEDVEFYIHRTGRTGRADFDGTSITLYDFEDDAYINTLEARGLKCIYMSIKDNELVPTKERNAREKRVRRATTTEEDLHMQTPLSKKVKPGYKKKRKLEIEKKLRKIKRVRIDNIYKKRAREK